jgi:hypothetical protein
MRLTIANWRGARRFVVVFVIATALLPVTSTVSAPETQKRKEKRTSYGTGVETAWKLVSYHDTCVLFRAFFISGNFFSGLHQIDGKQFVKNRKIYRTFPDSIIVDVQADAIPCDISLERLLPPDIAIGLLGELSFTATWRDTSADIKVISVVPVKVEHLNHGIVWDYFLEIPAKDVPLTAELVVDATARERIKLAGLSAHL